MGLALITGATSGIGRELVELFVSEQHDVVLVARNEGVLLAQAEDCRRRGREAFVLPQDLARPGAAVALVERLPPRPVDFLVNDAGCGLHGLFHEADPERLVSMLRLNVETVMTLTRLLLPSMLARRRGKVLNVASITAYFPGPYLAVYYATKAFIASLTEALHSELQDTGVTATCLCPNQTPTLFQERAGLTPPRASSPLVLDARSVAERGFRGMMQGRRTVVPGRLNAFLATLARLAPRPLVTELVGLANSMRGRE